MEYTDILKIIKGLMQTPGVPYHLIFNTTRSIFHPLERHLLGGRSFAPRSISIMITDRCNLRCRMCQYSSSESSEFRLNRAGVMSPELFKRILDTCPGKPMIALTGGEPLLHPQVLDFVRELKSRGFVCSLTTNGTFLHAKAAELCESQLDLLVVSIDGSEAIHDQIRSRGVFNRAVTGIREVLKFSDRPLIAISTVITDINFKELGKSFTLAQDLGVDLLNYNHLWMQTDQMVQDQQDRLDLPQSGRILWQVNTNDIDPERVFESMQSIRKKKHRFLLHEYPELDREQTSTYYRRPELLVKIRSSRCAWQTTKIYPDGEVGICREYHAGNVQDLPLREIWNNQRYRKYRLYLKEKNTCPICSRCCLVFSKL